MWVDRSGTGFIGKLVSEEIDLSRIPLEYLLKDGIIISGILGDVDLNYIYKDYDSYLN